MMPLNDDLACLLVHENEPGQQELSYRIGTYTTSLQRLKTFLAQHRSLDVGLHALDLYANESWAVALLEAGAMVVDILSFYQERIANEGYLRTAIEQRSIQYLVGMIGYEPRPGVAAQAYLAFTIRQTATAPSRRSFIPRGTIVQSIPMQAQPASFGLPTDPPVQTTPAQLPQIFETSNDFEARLEWNALKLSTQVYNQEHVIKSDLAMLRLASVNTGLRVGDVLLIIGNSGTDAADQQPVWIFAELTSVSTNKTKVFTEVSWQASNGNGTSGTLIYNPQVFVLGQKARLYAFPQGGIYYSPLDQPNWTPSAIGLPAATVHALALHNKTGALLAGTENGTYRSTNNGENWDEIKAGLLNAKLSAITCSSDGLLYAGSTSGNLYCSADGGNNWKVLISVPPRHKTLFGLAVPGQSVPNVSLPKSMVRKIAAFTISGTNYLAVAMADGVYLSSDQGKSWRQLHPDTVDSQGTTSGGAWSFALTHGGTKPFVGMDSGVFPLDFRLQPPKWWSILLSGTLGGLVLMILVMLSHLLGFGSSPERDYSFWSILSSNLVQNIPTIFVILLIVLSILLLLRLWWRIQRWLSIKHQQPDGAVHALAAEASNNLLAGTSTGIYSSSGESEHWTPVAQQPRLALFTINADTNLQADVAELDAGHLPESIQQAFAAQALTMPADAQPVVVNQGRNWKITDKSQPATYLLERNQDSIIVYRISDISVFETHEQKGLFAGTHDGQVYRSQDNGANWQNDIPNLPLASVEDLLVRANGLFAVGTNASNDSEGRWSRFQLQNKQLYLDKSYPGLVAGSWLILSQDQQCILYKAEAVATVASRDYKKSTKVTCVQVDRADGLATFDRRKATLFAQSTQLPLYNDDPVVGNMILLDSYITGFTPGHQILVSGKRARVSISSTSGQSFELVSADGQHRVPFDQLDTYILMAPPPAMTASTLVWLLKDRDDFVGTLTTDDKIIVVYKPARDDDESVGEMVAIQSFEQKVTTHNKQQQEQTLLILQSFLQNAYDRATVTISANVVAATHGRTIANEVLGTIGTTKASYRYPLKQKPLTYVAADTPSGVQSTLSVQVNQVRWHEVSSLEELASKRHSYLLCRDSQGNTIIYFGTGNRSANLPTGTEQLTATYRIGIGQVGNVPASSLTLLRNRPAGVQRVTNPLPASGGADPDTLDQMRSLAPLQTRTLQRIVSLNDYQTFTRMLGGVGKVQAKSVSDGRRQLVHITVAGLDGAQISRDSALYSELLNAIINATTSRARLVYLDSFEPLYFQIEARLRIDPDYVDSQETVITSVTQSLQTAFSFTNRDLAQDVPASEVIALLQNVAGVLAVEMQSLYIKDGQQPVALNPILQAKPARYEGGKLLPAQMLLLQSQNSDGIVLHMEV
jgi:hypothetical protein